MSRILTILEILVPIFTAVLLGVIARKKNVLSREGIMGLQQYVMQFGLPCVLFNSCLGANLGAEALTSMALVLPMMLISVLGAFAARKRFSLAHNLPMLFAAQESGMLGIPLFIALFGSAQAYRMGVLDMAQSTVAISVIALLSATGGEQLRPSDVIYKVFTSPLLLMSLLGLFLNLSGFPLVFPDITRILTASTDFLSQPVSAAILFSVGYNFSLGHGNRRMIFRIASVHFLYFALFGLLMQGILFLLPAVDPLTRWAIFLFTTLPSSFLSLGLGRNESEYEMAAGVCSLLTLSSLLVFCVSAVLVS